MMNQVNCLVLLFLVSSAASIAPVDQNFTLEFTDILRKRRRHLRANPYQPKHIAPGHCWFLSDQECLRDDEVVRKARDERRLVSVGKNIKVMVVLVRFSDHKDRELPDPSFFEEFFNGNKQGVDQSSVRQFMVHSSLGRYDVTFDVQKKWRTTDNTEAFFAGGKFGLLGADLMQRMAYPVLDEIANEGYDFYELDSGGWGDLDHFVIVHSGYPAENGNGKCVNAPAKDRIWSQGFGGTADGWNSPDYSYTVSSYMIMSAFKGGFCDPIPKPAQLGIAAHEYMHGFGLYDLYDNDRDEDSIPLGGCGRFGLMSNLAGWSRNQKIPGHLNPFSRVFAEWLDPVEITQDGFYAIQPSEISSQVYVIRKKYPEGEYLYIENRQPYRWDSDVGDASGITIYKIDENAKVQTARGYPGHPNWPKDHYMIAVLQADGKYDIEKGINLGDKDDLWVQGMTLGPGPGWPNTDAYSGGRTQKTGITIEILSDSSYVMLFKVSGLS